MGFKLTTDDKPVKVFVNEKEGRSGKFYTYSVSASSKDKDGNWVSGYMEVLFKKEATKPNNKDEIRINNAFPVVSEYNGNKYIKWFITDFEIVGAAANSDEGFINVPSELDDMIPFAPLPKR